MTKLEELKKEHGKPDITIGHFHLWIHSRRYGGMEDTGYWDDYLTVTYLYEAPDLSVIKMGDYFHTPDFEDFFETIQKINPGNNNIKLSSTDPNFKISFSIINSRYYKVNFTFNTTNRDKITIEDSIDEIMFKELLNELHKAYDKIFYHMPDSTLEFVEKERIKRL